MVDMWTRCERSFVSGYQCVRVSASRWTRVGGRGIPSFSESHARYERPCVIDLKIGVRTWDALHSTTYAEKRTKSEKGDAPGVWVLKCRAQTCGGRGALKRLMRRSVNRYE